MNPSKKTTPPERVPSVADYISAFRLVEKKINPNQRKILQLHYYSDCRTTTATDTAIAMGFKDHRAANMQYGKLGSLVSQALGLGSLGVITLVLMIPPNHVANEEWLWVMRSNVAEALEKIKWVEKNSHLFYPNGMIGPNLKK